MSDQERAASAGTAAIERWSLPEVNGPVVGRAGEDRTRGPGDASGIPFQDSEARGYEAGLARARAAMHPQIVALDASVKSLDSLLQQLSRPLQDLDAQVETELVQLALAVGKQLARRELTVDPTQVIAIVRDSLGQLPAAARDVRVHLHPADAATVRERLTAPADARAWTIVEDPTLSRGGCIVRTDCSQIDAQLESRVRAVTVSALGEERAADRQSVAAGAAENT
jgi:flagellar assembly protein FliH